jgi:hypothetical protein
MNTRVNVSGTADQCTEIKKHLEALATLPDDIFMEGTGTMEHSNYSSLNSQVLSLIPGGERTVLIVPEEFMTQTRIPEGATEVSFTLMRVIRYENSVELDPRLQFDYRGHKYEVRYKIRRLEIPKEPKEREPKKEM